MYLVSFTIKNFRKFRETHNTISFVEPKSISPKPLDGEALDSQIAQSSTLIIGKNNVGKTTIARALDFVIERKQPRSTDFNNEYLKGYLNEAIEAISQGNSIDDIEIPSMEFEFKISLNINGGDADSTSLLSNFLPLTNLLGVADDALVNVGIQVSIKEEQVFRQNVLELIHLAPKLEGSDEVDKVGLFKSFSDFMNQEVEFKFTYLNSNNEEVKNFSLKNLFKVKEIKANRHLEERVLSKLYGKIVKSEFTDVKASKQQLVDKILNINTTITDTVKSKGVSISEVLQEIEHSNHVKVDLSGNVTEKGILEELIKYSFSEGDDFIPEDQFGLGYINLLNIIGEIVGFVDSYEDMSHKNQINLLFIEEPESFMHPQMQEFFINRIDAALKKALHSSSKKINCQLIITTHSSHIVNSKIHSSNSFNNINYLCNEKRNTHVVTLEDC